MASVHPPPVYFKLRNRLHMFFYTLNSNTASCGLIDKNFPKSNPLNEILNRKTGKMSYSCTENVDQILNRHNKCLLMKETKAPRQQSKCNCKIPQNCPVENKCLTESVIYKATVKQPTGGQCEYIGLTDNAFKTRYNLHNHTFRNESKKISNPPCYLRLEPENQPITNITWIT